MGKHYPKVVVLVLGIILLMGHIAIAANPNQVSAKPYLGRVALQSTVFPQFNVLTEGSYQLQLQSKLVLPAVKPPLVKGIYVSGWMVSSESKMKDLIQLARDTEINAFVIDVKDDSGLISWNSAVKDAIETKANWVKHKDFKGLVERLKKENIYLIARVVTFKDAHMAKARPARALKLTKAGEVWADDDWISPFLKENWDYAVNVSKEAAEMGFDEIQFDYVRFPALGSRPTQVAQVSSMTKEQAINSFLDYARNELAVYGVPVSADIFGMVTSVDDLGIGQRLVTISNAVDVLSPMVYPSHYSDGNFNLKSPEQSPYETIYRSMKDAMDRLPKDHPVRLRPWLQDFSLKYAYGPNEVREQIQALTDLGIHEWLLWNPSSRYTKAALHSDKGGFRVSQVLEIKP